MLYNNVIVKIAFILPSLAQCGPVTVCHDLVNQLVNKVDRIVVYYFDDLYGLNFPCETEKIFMQKKVDLNHFDIVHSHGLRPNKYVWKYKKQIKGAKIATLHSYIFQDLKYDYNVLIALVYRYLWPFYLNAQDVIVTLSNHMNTYYKKQPFIKKKELKYIYNGRATPEIHKISKEEAALLNRIKKNYFILGSVCVINKIKGLHQVVDALQHNKNLFFVVVGVGPYKSQLEAQSKKLSVDHRILFLGFKKKPASYLSFFDAFVIPSFSEGLPLALLEAVSCKTPVICSNLPVFRELFNEDEAAFFELQNVFSLLKAIKKIETEASFLKTNSYKKYLKLFTPEVMAQNYLLLYKSLNA